MSAKPPTQAYELVLINFVRQLHAGMNRDELLPFINDSMEKLMKAFVQQKLEDSSDLRYNSDLAQALICEQNFSDLVNHRNGGHLIRQHMRVLMRAYLVEVNRSRRIRVFDRAKFGAATEYLGITIEWPAFGERNPWPDGNVLVLAVTVVVVAILLSCK